jgi:two-component system, OmpR family, sensor histidine kinase SenX3
VVTAAVERTGEDDVVEIRVSDNGIGIPSGEQERIFERFYRVDYARSRANGGTGLGLSIVKHIAAIHGGDVTVWSQVGRGSTFTITLPAHLPGTTSVPSSVEVAQRVDHEPQEAKR